MTVAGDFSYYQQRIPGLYFYLGVTPKDADLSAVQMLHSPRFRMEEDALAVGVRCLVHLAIAHMDSGQH